MIKFSCSKCGEHFAVEDDKGGKRGKCLCGNIIDIPDIKSGLLGGIRSQIISDIKADVMKDICKEEGREVDPEEVNINFNINFKSSE